MAIRINQQVNTPLGAGWTQGQYAIQNAQGDIVGAAVLVRLPVNEETRSALGRSNCVTPRAQRSALWVFQESELT